MPLSPIIKESLDAYAKDRLPLGSFLTAVVANDLNKAVCHADPYNLCNIRDIVLYVYNELPAECHGSRDRVRDWLKGKS